MGAVERRPHLWPSVVAGQSAITDVEIDAIYPTGNQYAVHTDAGAVYIPRILFKGTLSIAAVEVPFSRFTEYADSGTKERLVASAQAQFELEQRPATPQLGHITIDGTERLAIRVTRNREGTA
jgi:hypothetical protein